MIVSVGVGYSEDMIVSVGIGYSDDDCICECVIACDKHGDS